MADDILKIELTGPVADDVRAAAEARGLSPDEFVQKSLAIGLAAGVEPVEEWEEDMRRLEEPGEDIDADVVFAELRESIEKARAR